ncbi:MULTISPECIES: hypothetical protein [unclassified Streptomyces]|uniref:DUF7144 family membrane protein n=1 Tax=unclassified Streptomyces TaxID=2593676 RepID=UPI000A845912|nr:MULTISPECIES: hypothetical protein [unclassified Streptomyces]
MAPGHAHAHHEGGPPAASPPAGTGWASAGVLFAGVLLLVQGVLGMLQGIVGIAEDDVYAVIGDYVFEFTTTTWGWTHLVLGVLLAAIGWGILAGASWARVGGVAVAALAVVANFLWLPYQPLWALVSIAVGVLVIWALCAAAD